MPRGCPSQRGFTVEPIIKCFPINSYYRRVRVLFASLQGPSLILSPANCKSQTRTKNFLIQTKSNHGLLENGLIYCLFSILKEVIIMIKILLLKSSLYTIFISTFSQHHTSYLAPCFFQHRYTSFSPILLLTAHFFLSTTLLLAPYNSPHIEPRFSQPAYRLPNFFGYKLTIYSGLRARLNNIWHRVFKANNH